MKKIKRNKLISGGASEPEGRWITKNGAHIFIKNKRLFEDENEAPKMEQGGRFDGAGSEDEKKLTLGKKVKHKNNTPKVTPIGERLSEVKGAPMTHKEASSGKVNPNYGKVGYYDNCQTCVATYYARRLGYNVEALPYAPNNDMMVTLAMDPALAFIDKDGNDAVFNTVDGEDKVQNLSDSLNVGDIAVVKYFISSNKNGDVYHIIIAEKLNNGMRLYDPQTNEVVDNQVINQSIDVDFANIAGYDINKSVCREIMRGVKNDK